MVHSDGAAYNSGTTEVVHRHNSASLVFVGEEGEASGLACLPIPAWPQQCEVAAHAAWASIGVGEQGRLHSLDKVDVDDFTILREDSKEVALCQLVWQTTSEDVC